MDGAGFIFGLIVGLCIGAGAAVVFGASGTQPSALLTRSGRVSKGDLACRDCGTPMVERYPSSTNARRYVACPACGYLDSYLDHDRVHEYQQRNI